jgi:uroporphyrinogen-III synthase
VAPLHGIGVLVTRPEQQATQLCRLLEARGATTLRLAPIAIKPLLDSRARIEALDAFDLILFTSANAVRYGADALRQRRGSTVAAIGPATARALREQGYDVTLEPEAGYTSEALLAHPTLKHLAGRRILLIKGVDGRQTLESELTRRGADVIAIDVYQRVPANLSAADLAATQAAFAAGRLQVITATSLEIGKRLLEIVPHEMRAQFEKAHWLVPGQRVAAGLRDSGLNAPMLCAASAEDQELVAALERWCASASKA